MLRIALFGSGKMGGVVSRLVKERGHIITSLKEADVAIDFSHQSVVLDHLEMAINRGIPIVIGTTGWEEQLAYAKELVQKSTIAALYSPNFSVGVALFLQLLEKARHLFSEYDTTGIEYHHEQKVDAPSGTAKEIAKRLQLKAPFTSVRCGHLTGKHELIFDSPFDTVTLTHEARSREGFAFGSLKAAEWICGKKGWYTFDDVLRSLYSAAHTF